MLSDLELVRKVIEEHHSLSGQAKLVRDSLNDIEAFFSLQKTFSGWTLSSAEGLAEKRKQLAERLNLLDEGLRKHFRFEQEALPPLVGDLLMKALVSEHQQIRKELGRAVSLVSEVWPEGASQQELLSRKSQIQDAINTTGQIVQEHAAKEETMLKMLEETLAKQTRSP